MLIKVPFKGAFLMSNFKPAATDKSVVNPPTDLSNRAGWNDFINGFWLGGTVVFVLVVNNYFKFDTALLLIKE